MLAGLRAPRWCCEGRSEERQPSQSLQGALRQWRRVHRPEPRAGVHPGAWILASGLLVLVLFIHQNDNKEGGPRHRSDSVRAERRDGFSQATFASKAGCRR